MNARIINLSLLLLLGARSLEANPPNDRFATATRISGVSGQTTGTNVDATLENDEPQHAGVPVGASVWWRWVAPSDGGAIFDTVGSDYDTVIGVYTGVSVGALTPVAANDDIRDFFFQSEATFRIEQGTEYRIAVDGYGGDMGNIVLTWRTMEVEQCPTPDRPDAPLPGDGDPEVTPGQVILQWNAVRRLDRRVIYGRDDRQDVYQVLNPDYVEAWESTVALVSQSSLRPLPGGGFRLEGPIFGEDFGLCPEERFFDQPNPAWCSGFLVAPDLVITAGHCITGPEDCADVAFVFGFRMLDRVTPVLEFPESEIYYCQEIVARHLEDVGGDWAVIRLDRKVAGHEPLTLRREGRIGDNQSLVMIGHPSGLPAKIAAGARVRDNRPPSYFSANLDAYGGNSGSAVFNAETLEVEGILVRGQPGEFVDQGGCLVSLVCPDDGCTGEDVVRTSQFSWVVPLDPGATMYRVSFGPCGDLQLLGETEGTSWTVDGVEPGRSYCWQIEATNSCGDTLGPVWSFGTSDEILFRRGDSFLDGDVNLSDAITILNHLFLGGPRPECFSTADTDDTGDVNLTDGVYLLNHLFLGGKPPLDPFDGCGPDPTPDDLGCERYDECP